MTREEFYNSIHAIAKCAIERNVNQATHQLNLVMAEYDRLTAELAALRAEREWIPVGDRLPEEYVPVLLSFGPTPGNPSIGYHINSIEQWTVEDGTYYRGETYDWVVSWMPLPPHPKAP